MLILVERIKKVFNMSFDTSGQPVGKAYATRGVHRQSYGDTMMLVILPALTQVDLGRLSSPCLLLGSSAGRVNLSVMQVSTPAKANTWLQLHMQGTTEVPTRVRPYLDSQPTLYMHAQLTNTSQ